MRDIGVQVAMLRREEEDISDAQCEMCYPLFFSGYDDVVMVQYCLSGWYAAVGGVR